MTLTQEVVPIIAVCHPAYGSLQRYSLIIPGLGSNPSPGVSSSFCKLEGILDYLFPDVNVDEGTIIRGNVRIDYC